jgi:regulatory protein spx
MIKIYMSPGCSSCRKVKAWFDEQKIPYQEVNILSHRITREELKEMLEKSLNGTDDIISMRSKVIKEEKPDLMNMSISELIDFIIENPTVLKRPIIVDDEKIQVGYNAEEIEIFKKAKRYASSLCLDEKCPRYSDCVKEYQNALCGVKTASTGN